MATQIEESKHYNGEITIQFYPKLHRYRVKGERTYLIGVTTATGMVDKSAPLMKWSGQLITDYLRDKLEQNKVVTIDDIDQAQITPTEKRDEAAAKGTLVHEWAEAWIKDQALPMPEDEQVRNGVLAFLNWVNENDIRFISSERRVFSKKHRYVGTMDCEFTMGIENHKIIHAGDFKTSSGFYMPMAFQVSGYQHACTEEFGTKYGSKCIIRFDKDTAEFHPKFFEASEHKMHLRGFLASLELKRQQKEWDKTHNEYYQRKNK